MKTGIIGGSGLYDIEGLTDVRRKELKTPFGAPSDSYVCGRIGGHEVFFLPRHGRGHRILPGEINYRANILGFKMLGVERIVSVNAVGSLKQNLPPGDIVLPDQYYDRTKSAVQHTFFGNGVVAHVSFGEPACAELRAAVAASAAKVLRKATGKRKVKIHNGGTYVNMEGPAFSTKSESHFYRKLGFDIIGMTSLPEAKLCREAEICYQTLSLVTDYDCWHESEEPVTVEMVISNLAANSALAKEIVKDLIPTLGVKDRACGCGCAMQHAVVTERAMIPARAKKDLKLIIGKYL